MATNKSSYGGCIHGGNSFCVTGPAREVVLEVLGIDTKNEGIFPNLIKRTQKTGAIEVAVINLDSTTTPIDLGVTGWYLGIPPGCRPSAMAALRLALALPGFTVSDVEIQYCDQAYIVKVDFPLLGSADEPKLTLHTLYFNSTKNGVAWRKEWKEFLDFVAVDIAKRRELILANWKIKQDAFQPKKAQKASMKAGPAEQSAAKGEGVDIGFIFQDIEPGNDQTSVGYVC